MAGVRVAHMRRSLVLSPAGGALAKMLPAFRFGAAGKLGSGRQWWSWISLRDAARAFAFALENEQVHGALNLAAPHPVTNAEFTRTLGRVLHRPTLLCFPPSPCARWRRDGRRDAAGQPARDSKAPAGGGIQL